MSNQDNIYLIEVGVEELPSSYTVSYTHLRAHET